MKQIEVHVRSRDDEEPKLITINEEATVEELLKQFAPDQHAEFYIVVDDENEPASKDRKLRDCGIRHHHQIHCHPRVIHYTVDGEEQKTTKHKLTAEQIMVGARIDPKTHYLIRLKRNNQQVSYKDDPTKPIHLRDRMRFITASLCPTPVS